MGLLNRGLDNSIIAQLAFNHTTRGSICCHILVTGDKLFGWVVLIINFVISWLYSSRMFREFLLGWFRSFTLSRISA